MKTNRQARYRIFLMTFWLEEDGDLAEPETWRFRLEEPRNGTRWGCVGLTRLAALLGDKIAGEAIQKDE